MVFFERRSLFLDDRLIIGNFCSIATGVKFMMGGTQGHNYHWIATYPLDSFDDDFDGYKSEPPKGQKLKGDTVIGNDVWIGAEAMIMPGLKIADGAVIAARAVLTKNVGPYEIWGGNPARLQKKQKNGGFEKGIYSAFFEMDFNHADVDYYLAKPHKYPELR